MVAVLISSNQQMVGRFSAAATRYLSSQETSKLKCSPSSTLQPVDTDAPLPIFNRMDHAGGCHCGNIRVHLRLSRMPEDNSLRACTCSFCRSHSPRIVADPKGIFEVWADNWSMVENYRFGTRTCDFLICRHCGVFIAAIAETMVGTCAVVNVNCLSDRDRFISVPTVHDFEGETVEIRLSRRTATWMPAIIHR
jgi:hypothetical protein